MTLFELYQIHNSPLLPPEQKHEAARATLHHLSIALRQALMHRDPALSRAFARSEWIARLIEQEWRS